jgi:hypothetical protein
MVDLSQGRDGFWDIDPPEEAFAVLVDRLSFWHVDPAMGGRL